MLETERTAVFPKKVFCLAVPNKRCVNRPREAITSAINYSFRQVELLMIVVKSHEKCGALYIMLKYVPLIYTLWEKTILIPFSFDNWNLWSESTLKLWGQISELFLRVQVAHRRPQILQSWV